jgi:hypothetical protein
MPEHLRRHKPALQSEFRRKVTATKLIIIASHAPIFFSAGYAVMICRKLRDELKVFSWFLFISGILQLISLLLWWKGINNLPVLHLYVPAGFVALALFYHAVMKGFIPRSIIPVTAAVFVALSVLNSVFFQPLLTFNSYALTLESVLVIVLSLFTYILLLNKIVAQKKKDDLKSINWINAGIFIYYSTALLIFYFGDLITHSYSRQFNRYAWMLHSFLSVVMYLCFIIGLWKRQKK